MAESPSPFAVRGDPETVETGTLLMPKFDRDGLIVAIATDASSNEILMVAHMSAEALKRTIETGEAWFWSRSRQKLWKKGEDSGNRLTVEEIRVDCDQDAILIKARVTGDGVACHQGYRSCFYRIVPVGEKVTPTLTLSVDGTMPRKTT
jgi:phosphoribosyl-AMP cyclohydrolase